MKEQEKERKTEVQWSIKRTWKRQSNSSGICRREKREKKGKNNASKAICPCYPVTGYKKFKCPSFHKLFYESFSSSICHSHDSLREFLKNLHPQRSVSLRWKKRHIKGFCSSKTQDGEADLDWKLQHTNSRTDYIEQYCRVAITWYIQTLSLSNYWHVTKLLKVSTQLMNSRILFLFNVQI